MSAESLCQEIKDLADRMCGRLDDLIEQVETLTTGQRAAIGAKSLEMLREEAKGRQGGSGRFGSGSAEPKPEGRFHSAEVAAQQVGVGVSSINRAALVMREDPEAFERIKEGEANR